MSRVNVYDNECCESNVVARVKLNQDLDYWNGSNWENGGTGLHKGITRLRSTGEYVIIISTQWVGNRNYAYTVSKQDALREILESDQLEILDKYKELKEMAEELEMEEI